MPTTVSYPGLYIEEQPLSAHTIAAAPTSITVIVGYTHPLKTPEATFGQAVRLFSYADYEREFGGAFVSNLVESHVPQAVNQFFLNGGSDLYVVGLEPSALIQGTTNTDTYADALAAAAPLIITTTGGEIHFRPLEPIDAIGFGMTVSLTNLRQSLGAGNPYDVFDLTIFYGSRVETFRNLALTATAPGTQLWSLNGLSALVSIAGQNGAMDNTATFGTGFVNGDDIANQALINMDAKYTLAQVPADFVNVFQADTPLDKVPIFNILLTPGVTSNIVNSAALAFAERKRAFVILDAQQNSAADTSTKGAPPVAGTLGNVPMSENGALYFPYLLSTDPLTGNQIEIAPSGYVAGIYAKTDTRRGVWKAPAGLETTLIGTTGVVPRGDMTNEQQGVLYGQITQTTPINCLRSFPGSGTVVFGARTLVGSNSAYAQSKYVPVRRMTLFIEQTLLANLRWVVFEPNDEPLWLSIRNSVEGFMLSLFNQGALQGGTPSLAFQVKCDASTTTQDDINNGVVNIIVAFAPLKPAEFVVIKIAQLAGQSQS
jgi:phage tail sheath protein FI